MIVRTGIARSASSEESDARTFVYDSAAGPLRDTAGHSKEKGIWRGQAFAPSMLEPAQLIIPRLVRHGLAGGGVVEGEEIIGRNKVLIPTLPPVQPRGRGERGNQLQKAISAD